MQLRTTIKRTLATLACAATAFTVAACGAGAGSDSSDVAVATGDQITGDITVWSSFTQGPRAEWMEHMARKFEQEHPGTNVKIETFSWNEFNTKWTTGLTSGQVPDVSTALPPQVVEMINAEALLEENDVIDNIGRDQFPAPALREGEKDGKNYSVPIYSHAQVLWYRKDILEQHGLQPPKTWDELRQAVDKIGQNGDEYAISVPMGTNDFMATRYINFYLRSKGETLLNDDGSANLTSPAAQEAINYWADMFRTASPKGAVNYNVLDQATLFYQGKTAFDFNSGFHISGVAKNRPDLEDQIAATYLPVAEPNDPVNYPAEASNIAMVAWKASKNPGTAKAFLQFLYDEDEYVKFLHSVPGGMLPVLAKTNEDPAYLDNPVIEKYKPSIEIISEQVRVGTAFGMEDGPKVQSGILASQGIIERMMQSIVLENADPMEAAKKAEDELNAQFKAAGVTLK